MKKYSIIIALSLFVFTFGVQAKAPYSEFTDPNQWKKHWVMEEEGVEAENVHSYVTLATVSLEGNPSIRIVQAHETKEGFTFFTHKNTQKAEHLQKNAQVAINYWFPKTKRQVSIEGKVRELSKLVLQQTWQQMPRWMQLNMMASDHKSPLIDDVDLKKKVNALNAKYPDVVPMPLEFVGYQVLPKQYAFFEIQAPNHAIKTVALKTSNKWQFQRMQP